MASDDESQEYVARLERQVDNDEELLPSGDDLAAELEAFLRDQRPEEDAESSGREGTAQEGAAEGSLEPGPGGDATAEDQAEDEEE